MAVAAVLSSCSNHAPTGAAVGSAREQVTSTSSTFPTSTTTPEASTTTVQSRPDSTSVASSPEGYAKGLYEAWTKGDKAAAQTVAQPQAVDALFARQWKAGDGWSFTDCSGAAGSVICTWDQPGGQLLLRVQNVTGGGPVTVSEVKFLP